MYLDSLGQFSNAQALTGTAVSTNVIDLTSDRNIGVGEPMAVVISVDVALDGTTGDETYVVTLQTGTTATPTTVIGTITMTRGDAAGTQYVFILPADSTVQTFLRLNYTLGGTTPTGTLSADLKPLSMVQNDDVYAASVNIT